MQRSFFMSLVFARRNERMLRMRKRGYIDGIRIKLLEGEYW